MRTNYPEEYFPARHGITML